MWAWQSVRAKLARRMHAAQVLPLAPINGGDAATRRPRLLREASRDRRDGRGPIVRQHVRQVVHSRHQAVAARMCAPLHCV